MKVRQNTLEKLAALDPVLDLYEGVPIGAVRLQRSPAMWKRAAEMAPPFPKKHDEAFGAPAKRDIPKDHKFDPKALKPMSRMLWAMAVSLGHALTAYRQFTRLKSVTVSPDGLVGGRGYVMSVKDVRAKLYEACEALSAISDTIHDEINAPHWKPKLGELEKQDLEEIDKFVGEAEGILEDPEADADEEEEEVENKKSWAPSRFQEESQNASKLPSGGNAEGAISNPASASRPSLNKQARSKWADSSVNPDTLPGPRVQHLDRAEGKGPFGSFNEDEPLTQDEWGRSEGVGNEYNYPSEWENDFSGRTAEDYGLVAESGLPSDDETRTEGNDYGLGYGARGQGSEDYGLLNPSSGSYGVYGPRSDMPRDPGGKTRGDKSDTTPTVELGLNGRNQFASLPGNLPGDGEEPVARADYYTGPKGNDFNGVVRAEAALPGDNTGNPHDFDMGTTDTGLRHEQWAVPYVKWDDSTHNMRSDPTYQRGPVEGPYVHQQGPYEK